MDYFISDLHMGHKNVLGFDHRPFTSIEEHDAAIVKTGMIGLLRKIQSIF